MKIWWQSGGRGMLVRFCVLAFVIVGNRSFDYEWIL